MMAPETDVALRQLDGSLERHRRGGLGRHGFLETPRLGHEQLAVMQLGAIPVESQLELVIQPWWAA